MSTKAIHQTEKDMVVLVQMDKRIKVPMVLFGVKCFAFGHSGGVDLDGPGVTQNHFTGEGAANLCLQTSSYQSPFK